MTAIDITIIYIWSIRNVQKTQPPKRNKKRPCGPACHLNVNSGTKWQYHITAVSCILCRRKYQTHYAGIRAQLSSIPKSSTSAKIDLRKYITQSGKLNWRERLPVNLALYCTPAGHYLLMWKSSSIVSLSMKCQACFPWWSPNRIYVLVWDTLTTCFSGKSIK